MYTVLVQAMLIKLKVGSAEDVPIDEVLIYLESIPLVKNNELMDHLIFIENIKDQADKFKAMQLNMSLDHMIKSPEEVINKMVLYEMEDKSVMEIDDWQEFTDMTYQILAAVQINKGIFQSEI